MKNLLLSISLFLYSLTIQAQWSNANYLLSFEDSLEFSHLRINQNDLWQIGVPQKNVFNAAHSMPNVMVTDTTLPYPVNDTSTFEIVNTASDGWTMVFLVGISGYYQVNSDTLTDFGTMEVSPDNGTTWIDIIDDSIYSSYFQWWTPQPVLSGNSNGWQFFHVEFAQLGLAFNVQIFDTILFRFTFISDSIQTNKDGLMFDDIAFEDYYSSVPEVKNNQLVSIYPNPTVNELFIENKSKTKRQTVQLFDHNGRLVYENLDFNGSSLNTEFLQNGIYLLMFSTNEGYDLEKFVVQR